MFHCYLFVLVIMWLRSSKVLAVPLDNAEIQMHESMGRSPCEVESHRCGALSFPDLSRTRHAVEPRTGIEFPMILDNVIDGENYSSSTSEVNNKILCSHRGLLFLSHPVHQLFSTYAFVL